MRRLFVAACLVASICAYHVKHDYDVVIDKVEYTNLNTKFNFDYDRALAPIKDVLADIAEDLKSRRVGGTEAILNDYADKIFANIQQLFIHSGLDPFEMPDQHSGFNYTLIITYHGELDLTHGWLSDLSSVHRGGDVIASYSSETKYLEVTVPIAFDDLQFTYDYSAKIMGLGPTGGLAGKIANIGVRVKIGFDTANFVAALDEFYITDSGHIDLNFNGNPLVDWLLNLLIDVATALLKGVILLIVENIIRGGLDSVITIINDAIGGILNPATTPVPTVTQAAFYAYA